MSLPCSLSYCAARSIIEDLCNDQFYDSGASISEPIKFMSNTSKSRIIRHGAGKLYDVEISFLDLEKGKDACGRVRDCDVVWTAKHVFHEARHLEHFEKLFKYKDAPSQYVDMARMEAIASTFSGYDLRTYNHRPAELDAELMGTDWTVDHFDINYLGPDHRPLIDARAGIAWKLQEEGHWKGFRLPDVSDGKDAFEAYRNMLASHMKDYLLSVRPDLFNEDDLAKPVMQRLLQDDRVSNVLLDSKPVVGRERDRQLLPIVADINPSVAALYPCLKDDISKCRKDYPSPVRFSDKIRQIFVPSGIVTGSDVSEGEGRVQDGFGSGRATNELFRKAEARASAQAVPGNDHGVER